MSDTEAEVELVVGEHPVTKQPVKATAIAMLVSPADQRWVDEVRMGAAARSAAMRHGGRS